MAKQVSLDLERPILARLGNHQYLEISYLVKLHHPNTPIILPMYTFAHFFYALVQYGAVLQDAKVCTNLC